MRALCLILVLLPAVVQASCTDETDPAYHAAVHQGNYAQAFDRIAEEIHLSQADKNQFKIIPGYSQTHDDRHGQADPDTLEVSLDPGLFWEGESGACQGVVHELTHLRQFERDRRLLHAYFSTRAGTHQAEEEAYGDLQDNDLVPHAAAMEIEAVLAQIPYAPDGELRDEDSSYLVKNISDWAEHRSMVFDRSNESYYLPDIKKRDTRLFCRGEVFIRELGMADDALIQTAKAICGAAESRSTLDP